MAKRPPGLGTRFDKLIIRNLDETSTQQAEAQAADAIKASREAKRLDIARIVRADAAATAALLVGQGKRSFENVMGKPLGGDPKIIRLPFWIIGYGVKSEGFRPFFGPEVWKHPNAIKMGLGLNDAGDLLVFTDANTDHPVELVQPECWEKATDEMLVPTALINEARTRPANQEIVDYWRTQLTDNLAQRILYGDDPSAPDGAQRLDQIPRLRSWRQE